MSASNKHFTPRIETALREKLSGIRNKVRKDTNRKPSLRDPMPSTDSIGVDGEGHINVWENGATELGRALAHSTKLQVVHNIFGRFNSVESFWHYIRSVERDDRIRSMSGNTLKNFAEKLTVRRVPNFCAMIMDTNWQKVKQYPAIAEEIKKSTAKFDCYYVYKRSNGVRIRPAFAYWVIPGFEEIRRALLEDRQPNFDFLKDNRDAGIYDAVTPEQKQSQAQQQKSKKPKKQQQESKPEHAALTAAPGVVEGRGLNQSSIPVDEVAFSEEVKEVVVSEATMSNIIKIDNTQTQLRAIDLIGNESAPGIPEQEITEAQEAITAAVLS